MTDTVLFIVMPYVALFSLVFFTILRIRKDPFSFSSLSSQFLESDQLFWGSNAWHFGLLIVFPGHLIALLFPGTILSFNAEPFRLFLLEATGLAGGFLMAFGLAFLFFRRIFNARVNAVTSPMDILVLLILGVLVTTGLSTAIGFNWGSSWFAAALAPYLYSLAIFQPELSYVVDLPHVVKMHILSAFLFVGMLPFTRLVHMFSLPLRYPFRPNQVVMWNWDRKEIRYVDGDEEEEKEEEWTFGV